jgi:hypothetical protein
MRKIKEIFHNIYYQYFHISMTRNDFTTHYYDEDKFNNFLKKLDKMISSNSSSR